LKPERSFGVLCLTATSAWLLLTCSSPGSVPPDSGIPGTDASTSPDASSWPPDSGSSIDAGSSDAGQPDSGGGGGSDGGLGTLTVNMTLPTCPPGAARGAKCTSVTVSCPGLPDIGATIADVEPPGGAPRGTVVAHEGGTGIGYFNGNTGNPDAGFSESFTAANLRYVQVAWGSDWASTGTGIKAAACRPATAFRWIFDNIHGGIHTKAFCGTGSSGGTAALLYSITAYGLKDIWDYLALAAGPTPSRIDYGCDPSLYDGGSRDLCPLLTNAPWSYSYVGPGSSSIVQIANGWEGTKTCGAASPPQADIATWARDGLVSPGDDFTYPQTAMTFWYCVTAPNQSTGESTFYIEQVQPMNSPPPVNCYSGTCQGEEVFEDPSAFNAAVSDMTTLCMPNH
jgi:hypothetical protein